MGNGTRMVDQNDLLVYTTKFDDQYGPTYFVLDALQKVFYTTDAARESFVELCEEEYVQKVTFDSYLYKTVQGNDPIGDMKLGIKTSSHSGRTTSPSLSPCGSWHELQQCCWL